MDNAEEEPIHEPVLLEEVVEGIRPQGGGRYADGTVGGGGHAYALLERSSPDGWLLGCDRDPAALAAAGRRLQPFTGRFELRQGVFGEVFKEQAGASFDGVVLDLGVSAFQLEASERGFSHQAEGPLDMRMDPSASITAADWVNRASVDSLIRIFREYGEERYARRIARAIEARRMHGRFESTADLAGLVEQLLPRGKGRIHPATRVFQALRIAVNDELRLLEEGLGEAWRLLCRGGRLAVITFHSLEARRVKAFGRRLGRKYRLTGPEDRPEWREPAEPELSWITRKPVTPSAEEIRHNPRARSAQLRVFEKL